MNYKIKDIVRQARGEMSQTEFARLLGKSQGVLSKYERGEANPPAETIEVCLQMIGNSGARGALSSDSLAKRIRSELKKPEFAYVRRTIVAILDGIAAHEET